MANKKITELIQTNLINSNDILPIVQSGETKKLNFETITKTILNTAFPIGKVEVFFDNDDHSNYLGFEWERTAIGKTPVGIDESDTDFNTIGKTGGEKEHTLVKEELPNYALKGLKWNDSSAIIFDSIYAGNGYNLQYGSGAGNTGQIDGFTMRSGGNDQPHNNLQPYEVMAFWKRVR